MIHNNFSYSKSRIQSLYINRPNRWWSVQMAHLLPRPIRYSILGRIVRSYINIPRRLPSHATKNDIQDRNVPSKQYFIHKNSLVYPTGEVCISILHPPFEDPMNPQERVEEKWNPILTIEAVIMSITSMLVDPNLDSPANVDAAKLHK